MAVSRARRSESQPASVDDSRVRSSVILRGEGSKAKPHLIGEDWDMPSEDDEFEFPAKLPPSLPGSRPTVTASKSSSSSRLPQAQAQAALGDDHGANLIASLAVQKQKAKLRDLGQLLYPLLSR